MKTFVLKKSRFKAFRLIFWASVMFSIGTSLILKGDPNMKLTGSVWCVLTGCLVLLGLMRLLDRRPQLIADEDRVYDRQSMTAPVGWASVEQITLKRSGALFTKQHVAEVTLTPFSGENLSSKIKSRRFGHPPVDHKPYRLTFALDTLEGDARAIVNRLNELRANYAKA